MAVYYENGGIVVDNARYIVGSKMYPLNSIASVDISSYQPEDRYVGEKIVHKQRQRG